MIHGFSGWQFTVSVVFPNANRGLGQWVERNYLSLAEPIVTDLGKLNEFLPE